MSPNGSFCTPFSPIDISAVRIFKILKNNPIAADLQLWSTLSHLTLLELRPIGRSIFADFRFLNTAFTPPSVAPSSPICGQFLNHMKVYAFEYPINRKIHEDFLRSIHPDIKCY